MQLTYLCVKHADWVYNNPREASYFLSRDENQGRLLFNSGNFAEAIPYLGCAFDIAAILLELEEQEPRPLLNKAQSLSYLLATAYHAAERLDFEQAVALRTIEMVNAVISAVPSRTIQSYQATVL